MKDRILQSTEYSANPALYIKSNEAYQSYLNDIKELERLFEDVLKDKSFVVDVDNNAKNKAISTLEYPNK